MNWFDWIFSAWLVIGALATISVIGKPRQPVTPGIAVVVVLFDTAAIVGLALT